MSAPAPTPCGVDPCAEERITADHIGGGLCYRHWQEFRALVALRIVEEVR